jgi:hypothetical protein
VLQTKALDLLIMRTQHIVFGRNHLDPCPKCASAALGFNIPESGLRFYPFLVVKLLVVKR